MLLVLAYLLVGLVFGLLVSGTTPNRRFGLFAFFLFGWGPFLAYALLRK